MVTTYNALFCFQNDSPSIFNASHAAIFESPARFMTTNRPEVTPQKGGRKVLKDFKKLMPTTD